MNMNLPTFLRKEPIVTQPAPLPRNLDLPANVTPSQAAAIANFSTMVQEGANLREENARLRAELSLEQQKVSILKQMLEEAEYKRDHYHNHSAGFQSDMESIYAILGKMVARAKKMAEETPDNRGTLSDEALNDVVKALDPVPKGKTGITEAPAHE